MSYPSENYCWKCHGLNVPGSSRESIGLIMFFACIEWTHLVFSSYWLHPSARARSCVPRGHTMFFPWTFGLTIFFPCDQILKTPYDSVFTFDILTIQVPFFWSTKSHQTQFCQTSDLPCVFWAVFYSNIMMLNLP